MPKLFYIGDKENEDEAIADLVNYTGPIGVDTETISLLDRTGIGIGIATPGARYYFQILPETSRHLRTAMEILARPWQTKVYFNALFDLRVLKQVAQDFDCPPPDAVNLEDASIMAQVQGSPSNELDELSGMYLGYNNPFHIKELLLEANGGKKGATMLDVDFQKIGMKNSYDTMQTLQLYEYLKTRWPNMRNQECYIVDLKLIPILLAMEDKGVLLDQDKVEEHYVKLRTEVNGYEEICDKWGFKPSSPQQVGYILALEGELLPFTKGKRRQLRTDEETLESLSHPLAFLVLQYRKVNKLLGTYVVPYRSQERAYTHFRIDLATGRLASGMFGKSHEHVCRNMQNVPAPMREIYLPDADEFDWMDFSQIEMRLLAGLSHDENMLAAYRNNWSIHEMTMKQLWPNATKKDNLGNDTWEYLTSKTFNFAMAYYAQDGTLAKHTKLPIDICSKYKQYWLDYYSGCKAFMEARMADPSPVAETEFGRRMFLPDIDKMREASENAGNWFNPNSAQNHINKCKINYVIQGTGADIIKRGMLMVDNWAGSDIRLQVHDELVNNGKIDWPEQLSSIHPDIPTPFESHSGRVWR